MGFGVFLGLPCGAEFGSVCRPSFWVRRFPVCSLLSRAAFSSQSSVRGQETGPPGGPHFGSVGQGDVEVFLGSIRAVPTKAAAYFQWINFALSSGPTGLRPLVLNMDETAIGRCFHGLRGTIVTTASKVGSPSEHASLSQRRSYISYLACVADDPAVQAKLPQVLLGNKHQFTLNFLRSAAGTLPPNIQLWRQTSSWNSHSTMRKWLSLLAKSLGKLMSERYVVLLLDVHPSHIHNSIFLHARRCGVRIVYIPAKMTWLLQPCDTHVFARLKLALRLSWQDQKSRSPDGEVSTEGWMRLVCNSIVSVVSKGDWRRSFLRNGVLDAQQQISDRLRAELGVHGDRIWSNEQPTPDAVMSIFPSRWKVDVLSYVLWQPKSQRGKGREESSCLVSASSRDVVVRPVVRRVLPATFQQRKTCKTERVRTLD